VATKLLDLNRFHRHNYQLGSYLFYILNQHLQNTSLLKPHRRIIQAIFAEVSYF